MSKLIKIIIFLLLIICLFYILVFSPYKLIGPYKISGGNPGKYHDGDYVLVASLKWPFAREINKGDVILFQKPIYNEAKEYIGDYDIENIGEVTGFENESVPGNTYYFSDKLITDKVPEGHYLIRLNKATFSRVIPFSKVLYKVWYP